MIPRGVLNFINLFNYFFKYFIRFPEKKIMSREGQQLIARQFIGSRSEKRNQVPKKKIMSREGQQLIARQFIGGSVRKNNRSPERDDRNCGSFPCRPFRDSSPLTNAPAMNRGAINSCPLRDIRTF